MYGGVTAVHAFMRRVHAVVKNKTGAVIVFDGLNGAYHRVDG